MKKLTIVALGAMASFSSAAAGVTATINTDFKDPAAGKMKGQVTSIGDGTSFGAGGYSINGAGAGSEKAKTKSGTKKLDGTDIKPKLCIDANNLSGGGFTHINGGPAAKVDTLSNGRVKKTSGKFTTSMAADNNSDSAATGFDTGQVGAGS